MKFRYRRLGRVNPRMGAEFRLRPGLWAACRRRAGRAGQVCHVSNYERLRAFASSYERLRACSSAPGRVSSRLVAFSRANFFFVFGHVRARLGVFFRHFSSFLVILRHSSSQNGFFGNGGQRVVAAAAGQGGQQFAAHGSRAGRGMCKMAWHSFEIGMQLRQGRGCVRFVLRTIVLHNRDVCSCWRFQGVSRNGGAFLSCFEGQDSQQLSELWFRQSVCWRQLTAAAQAASSLTRIRRSCGSILATGNLHLSPIGAVLQQARKPKPAAGERPAIAGARSPKIWDAPRAP